MSFYVKREYNRRTAWTGPIRSERQAHREAAAWQNTGRFAEVVQSTSEVRKQVRDWEQQVKAERA